jgi:hypothetical protein
LEGMAAKSCSVNYVSVMVNPGHTLDWSSTVDRVVSNGKPCLRAIIPALISRAGPAWYLVGRLGLALQDQRQSWRMQD